jgi:hypothetical protein
VWQEEIMSSKIKILCSYLLRCFWIFVGAVIFGAVTFSIIWRLSGESMTIAYILNGLTIVVIIVEDKLRLNYLYKRKKKPFRNKIISDLFDFIVVDKHDLSSMKTSLYLFYIFALVSSHMLNINPYLEVSDSVRNYFATVEYGLVILLAVDTLVGQFIKDGKHIKTYEEKRQSENS